MGCCISPHRLWWWAVLMVGKTRADMAAWWGGALTSLSNSGRRASVSLRMSDCVLLSTARLFSVFAAIKMTTVICGDAAGWRLLFYGKFIADLRVLWELRCCFSIDSHIKRILQHDYRIETLHVVRAWQITSELYDIRYLDTMFEGFSLASSGPGCDFSPIYCKYVN